MLYLCFLRSRILPHLITLVIILEYKITFDLILNMLLFVKEFNQNNAHKIIGIIMALSKNLRARSVEKCFYHLEVSEQKPL